MVDGNRNRTAYVVDAWGRITEIEKPDWNGVITEYAYNLYGAPLYRREKGSPLGDTYAYTPEGLLKSAISGGMRYSYTYDAMGRLKEKSASGRRLFALDYDRNGNLARQIDVTGKVTEYRYNLLDQLTEVWSMPMMRIKI